jgi:hypothetical protein
MASAPYENYDLASKLPTTNRSDNIGKPKTTHDFFNGSLSNLSYLRQVMLQQNH